MSKYVKVILPIDQPEDSLKLSDLIIKKDTAEGAGSSLAGVIDMADFTAKVTLAKNKRDSATVKERDAQTKFSHIRINAGVSENQNEDIKDVLLWYIRQVRDLLLVIYNGSEEDLTPFGYNVVITTSGGRKHVRVDIPEQPEEIVELAEDIVAHDAFLAAASPLTPALVDMAAFGTLTGDTRTLLNEWTELRGEIQALHMEALNIIGYGVGQKITTVGTLYNYFGNIRNRLLQKFKGDEENVSNWGFKVLVKSGKKKGASTGLSIKGKLTDTNGNPVPNGLLHLVEPDIFTLSDEDGNFEYETQSPGNYTIQAFKTGFESEPVALVVVAGQVTTVTIEIVPESALGTISGTVTKTGLPAAATITILSVSGSTVTNPSGEYITAPVPSGAQSVRATLIDNPSVFLDIPANVPAGGNVVVNFGFP
ncbi:MAG: carboxypeptidase-like regulatory domain-containing protein [Bacteroidota bacterium]